MCLAEANCRVDQANAVLSMWLERTEDKYEACLVSSLITILDGVNEAIEDAENKLLELRK
jgi:hypothetical protein